ncbi:MAG: GNAT family N-acetyltransferase [Bacteroidota bacterium]
MTDKNDILNNRLEFIAHHRDHRETLNGVDLFHSKVDYFKTAFLFNKNGIKKIPRSFELYLPEWLQIDHAILKKNGWEKTNSMIHMTWDNEPENWKINPDITISKIEHESRVEEFCKTQSRGFNGEDIDKDPCYPTMLASTLKNLSKSNHHFYLASLNGEPAGAIVLFFHEAGLGIYAVTTIEKFRKKGISTSLMKRALDEGKKANSAFITLQTMEGTYAEKFYETLGFTAAFHSDVFKQKTQ